ncbi:MAG: hypothetical protein WD966_02615 [Nitrosopumilaceae archaeon]
MSHEIRRRVKKWFTAMGVFFIVMALIVLTRNLLIWGPEFVLDFFISAEVTNEKISAGMLVFGILMIFLGFRKTR